MTTVVGRCCSPARPSAGACSRRFPCLSDRATRATIGVRVMVVMLHAVLVGVLSLLDADLIRPSRDRPWYMAIYLVLVLTTLVQYFFTSYSSPGYVLDAIRRGSDTPNLNRSQTVPRSEDSNLLSRMSIVWSKRVTDLYPSEISIRQCTCSYCKIIQPPRSRHCPLCDKCILQFDHHCGWLGTCIGKGNHSKFWWFLLEETILCGWTGFFYLTFLRSQATKAWWKVFIIVIMFVVLAICFMFLLALLMFHTYLAFTNQTTYEVTRRRRIVYFRGLSDKVRPFSRGICRNLYTFCCDFGSTYTLEVIPPVEELEAKARPYTCIDVVTCRCC